MIFGCAVFRQTAQILFFFKDQKMVTTIRPFLHNKAKYDDNVGIMGDKYTETENVHFDEMFITGCTGRFQNDNFQCSQWWRFRQNDGNGGNSGLLHRRPKTFTQQLNTPGTVTRFSRVHQSRGGGGALPMLRSLWCAAQMGHFWGPHRVPTYGYTFGEMSLGLGLIIVPTTGVQIAYFQRFW